MRTTAADRSHNATQRNTTQTTTTTSRSGNSSLLLLLPSARRAQGELLPRAVRSGVPAAAPRLGGACLPACLQPKLCRLATSGNVSSSAGRMAPPKLAGERPTEKRSEGFTFGTPVLGREVIRCPGTWTRRISGAIIGECFFGFSLVRKGGVISVQVRGLRSVST